MRPARRVACAVLAVAVVTSVVYATGAFSSTTAERDANVKVAGDASAFLSLQESNGPNAALASYGDNGALQVKIGGAGSRASGVNPDSQTEFENVFLITNKGAQSVSVWLTDRSPSVTFTKPDGTSLEGRAGSVELSPGGQPLHVGITVDARNVRPDTDLLESVKIRTDTTVEGESVSSANKEDTPTPTPAQSGGDSGGGGGSEGDRDSGGGGGSEDDRDSGGGGGSEDDRDSGGDDGDENRVTQVLEGAKALLLGFTTGDWGMPGGWFSLEESSSPVYLIGMLLNAVAPGPLDMVADLRDLVAKAASGDLVSMGGLFNAIGMLPVFGAIDDVRDLGKTVTKWMDEFPSNADKVGSFLRNGFIKYLPDGIGGKLLGMVSDAPVSKLTDADIPVKDITKYQKMGDVNYQRVLELRRSDVPAEDIRYYVDNDIDLGLVKELRDEGMNTNRIRFFLGDGSKKAIGDLRGQDLSQEEIADLIDEGADLSKASKLRSQNVPKSDIKYYVDNDISLKGVSKLQDMKFMTPKRTKKLLKGVKTVNGFDKFKVSEDKIGRVDISNEMVKKINKRIEGTHRFSKKAIAVAASAANYKGWKDARQDSRTQTQNRSARRSI